VYVLRIEHPVPDYDGWKRAFDSDPLDRKGAGVRRFIIFRSVDATNHVSIDLEFESLSQAKALLSALQAMWERIEGTVMSNANAQILEEVEDTVL